MLAANTYEPLLLATKIRTCKAQHIGYALKLKYIKIRSLPEHFEIPARIKSNANASNTVTDLVFRQLHL